MIVFEFLGAHTPWAILSLGDLLKINKNSWITIDDLSTYRILGVTARGNGAEIKRSVIGAELTMKKYQKVSTDQLMWCKVDTKNGAFGITQTNHEGTLASLNMCLADINTEICLPKFLQYFFRLPAVYDRLTALSIGTTNRQYLTPHELMKSVRLHVPLMDEQRRIVARIEELAARIEEARELRRRVVEETEALIASMLSKMFDYIPLEELPAGWIWRPLNSILINKKDGLTTGPFGTLLQKSEVQLHGIPILGISNVESNRFVPGFRDYITPEKADFLSSYKLKAGDIVIARSGTVGRSCIIPEGLASQPIMSTNLLRMRLDTNEFSPKLLCMLLNSSALIKTLKDKECRGSTRDFFTQKILFKLILPVPPLEEQYSIVAYLDGMQSKLDALKRHQVETSAELDALLPAVLERAFRGEL